MPFIFGLEIKAIDKPVKWSTKFLKQRIKSIFKASNSVYGLARIQKKLESEQLFYSRSYIAYLMQRMRFKNVLNCKLRVCTTDSNHSNLATENKLNRKFFNDILGEKMGV